MLLGSADVQVVRLPDEVGPFLAVPDHLADESLQVVAGVVERPGEPADLDLFEPREHLADGVRDVGVLVAQTLDRAREARGMPTISS